MADDKLFFIGQKAFIEKSREVLVLNSKSGLTFPGGKIQEGEEDFIQSLKREVTEETGLDIEVGNAFTIWHNSNRNIYLVGFRCKYKSGEVRLNDEHISYKWVNKNNYLEMDDGSNYFQALKKYFEEQ